MSLNQMNMLCGVFRQQGFSGVAQALCAKVRNNKQPDASSMMSQEWTEYMKWLCFANAGMLERGNVACFDFAVKNLPSQAPIVEIGSFCGLSTNMITLMKEKYGVKNPLFTCDKWLFEGYEQGGLISNSISYSEYRAFVKESYIRNIQMFSRYDLPYTIEVFSDEFFELWATSQIRNDVLGREIKLGGPISFCYIDGNHTYEYVRRDFDNVDKYLERGGFLLFDDSKDGSKWEVCRLVQEVMRMDNYELVCKNPNYFFRKKA